MIIKRGINVVFLLVLLIIPLSSATITITSTTNSVYNLGDTIPISATVQTSSDSSLNMDLVCGINKTNFYKNIVASGSPTTIQSILPVSKSIIGDLRGDCVIRTYFPTEEKFTNTFEISESIIINSNLSKTQLNPGENLLVKGNAVKANGKTVNGFVELSILDGNSTVLNQAGTVDNGAFSLNLTLQDKMKAGNYVVRVMAYEQDLLGGITNNGVLDQNLQINQVPTSLDIVFENINVEPGTNVQVKSILYDQTGVRIDSLAFLTIKNSGGKIMEQIEKATDEILEFPIMYNEAPSTWKVVAVSNKLTTESNFTILEKENISIEIINKTVLITNTGNVPYNKTVLIKIGNQSLNIDVYLKVDQSDHWLLTAPDGEYDVQVVADGAITGASIALTGDSINVRKASASLIGVIGFPVWIFILSILGFVTFIFFKRGYQKSFIGYIGSKLQKKSDDKPMEINVYNPKSSRAELTLSIRGDKQDVSMINVKIRNMLALKHSKEGGGTEILDKITELAETHKAATYESSDGLSFIFAPSRTKTFKNEPTALKTAQRINEVLEDHNRMFKQKVDFGISLNAGEIIAKQEQTGFKFMGVGNFMIQSKKIAALAEGNILMGEKITDRLRAIVKTEKHKKDGMDVYSIKEIKDPEKHEKFLKGFMKRQGAD